MSDHTETDPVGDTLRTGARLRCPRCGSEAIVTGSGPARLRCCDGPLESIFPGTAG